MKKKLIIFIAFLFVLFGSCCLLYLHSFELNGKEQIEVALGKKYVDEGVKAKFFFVSLESFVKKDGSVNIKKPGTYEITYHLPLKTLKRTVIVKDKTAPKLTLQGRNLIQLSYGNHYVEEGFQALDDVDGDITEKVKVTSNIDETKIDTYEIVYQVEDTAKNKTIVKRTVKIVDDLAPTLELKGSSPIYIDLGKSYSEPGYSASDNYDGDLTDKVVIDSSLNCNQVGNYQIKYSVQDSCGNRTEKERTVIVQKSQMTYINGILLVNKTHPVPSSYAPGENKEARQALTALQNDAKNHGYYLPLLSGYRSYSYQKTLYQNYVNRDGEEKANTYSAKPGQSEHQTGLAFDIGELNSSFGRTPAGIWLRENAHRYGFIIRYPEGKEAITGYAYEPWHVRYINVQVATEIYQRNITLEEYLQVS